MLSGDDGVQRDQPGDDDQPAADPGPPDSADDLQQQYSEKIEADASDDTLKKDNKPRRSG